jgi:hypothetical protein
MAAANNLTWKLNKDEKSANISCQEGDAIHKKPAKVKVLKQTQLSSNTV